MRRDASVGLPQTSVGSRSQHDAAMGFRAFYGILRYAQDERAGQDERVGQESPAHSEGAKRPKNPLERSRRRGFMRSSRLRLGMKGGGGHKKEKPWAGARGLSSTKELVGDQILLSSR